jgi:hypothetical protein
MIVRDVPIEQTTHIPPSGPLDVPAINIQFSKLIAMIQQIVNFFTRAIHFPDSDSTLDGELAAVATRKNKLLGFGTSGELIYPLGPTFVNSTSTGVADVDSRSTAQVTSFAISVNVVRTHGFAAAGDGGSMEYIRGTIASPSPFQDADGTYWTPAPIRQEVSSALDIYASLTGLTTNTGRTALSPWPAQYAIDYVCDRIIINNVRVKVHLAAGGASKYPPLYLRAYVGTVNVDPGTVVAGVPGSTFTVPWLCGDPADLEAVHVDGAGNYGVFGVSCHTPWFITDMRVSGNAAAGVTGDGILADFGTTFYIGNVRFGVGAHGLRLLWQSKVEFVRGMTVGFYPGCNIGVRASRSSQILAQLPSGPNFYFLNSVGGISVLGTGPNYVGAFAYAGDKGSRIDLTGVNSWPGVPTGVAAAEVDGGEVTSAELLPFGTLPVIYYNAPGFSSEGSTTAAAGVVAASTWTKVIWGNNTRNDGGWSRATFPTDSYAPSKPGWYIITLQLEMAAIVDGKIFIAAIYRNGVNLRQSPIMASGATEEVGAQVTAKVYLDGFTQYLEAYVFHNDAGPQTLNASVVKTQFFGYRL